MAADHAWQGPLSLDQLIAEAKRRARQRRFLVAVAVFLIAAAGAGAALVASSSSGVTPLQAALEPAVIERPAEHMVGPGKPARFSIVVGLTNGSREPVTLEGVRAALAARSRLRQIATRFKPYNYRAWVVCPGIHGMPGLCIPPGQFRSRLAPHGARSPSSLRVVPGREALVQLTFRNRTCTIRAMKESMSIQKIAFVYRLPDGTRIYQYPRLPLSVPAVTVFRPLTTSAMPAIEGQPASSRKHTVGWFTTNPCHR